MKKPEQWMEKIKIPSAQYGIVYESWIEFIKEIQDDAVKNAAVSIELAEKNDALEARNQELEKFLSECVNLDCKIIPTSQASPELIAHSQTCGCFISLPDNTGLILALKNYQK